MSPQTPSPTPPALTIDPQVQSFCKQMGAGFAGYPEFSLRAPVQARQIAEKVRAPWRQGGPMMHATFERQIPVEGGTVRVRVYNPTADAGPKPALVYMHGGGWVIFSIDSHDRLMREYAARASVIVIGVDYALAPEARFPVALNQVVSVVRWLATHGAELGVDANRIAVGGDSAGGNLALAAAVSLRDSAAALDLATGHDQAAAGDRATSSDRATPGNIVTSGAGVTLKAMLLNYGAFGTQSSSEATRLLGAKGAMLEHEEMQLFWAMYFRSPQDADNPLACPLLADVNGLPPAFLTIPEFDLLTEQSLALADKFRAAKVPVRAEVYKGATHSFLEAVSIAPLAVRALEEGATWLRETLA